MVFITVCQAASGTAVAQPPAASSAGAERGPAFRPFTFSLTLASGFDRASAATRSSDSTRSATNDAMPAAPTRFAGELAYAHRTRRTVFGASAGGALAYQPGGRGLRASSAVAQAASAHLQVTLGRRTDVEMHHRVASAPLELFDGGSFGGYRPEALLAAAASDTALTAQRIFTYDGTIALRRRLGPQSSAVVRFTSGRSSSEESRGFSSTMLSGTVTKRVTRFASLRAGYGFGVGRFGELAEPQLQHHDVDAGVEYVRPLPFGQSTLSVGTGSSVLASERTTRFRWTTTARLERHLARFWNASVSYARPVQFIAGFREPLLSDAFSAEVRGQLARRVSTELTVQYATGAVGLARDAARFTNYSGVARLAVQVHRGWRIEIAAHEARYRFELGQGLPAFIPERFVRHGVRAGVAWSSPVGRR